MWTVNVAVVIMMVLVATTRAAPQPEAVQGIDLFMPKVKPQLADTYLCRSLKVEDARRYITGFIPKADSMIAHHILLYGCDEPGSSTGEVWNCGEMSSTSESTYKLGSVCKSGNNILYAWAMEAPRLILPQDVSFEIGQDTPIKHLVVQVHYKNVTKFQPPQNGDDSSGLQLITTRVPTSKQAGVYLMLTGGYIPTHTIEYFETACNFDEDVEIVPFAYRTHAHSLGRVISGYRIRDGEWTEIGRQDPRHPQMFYNVSTPGITVKQGDILAARCTMENTLTHDVAIGSTQNDEMCNFYIMYYVNRPPILKHNLCVTLGPPMWYWQDFDDQKKLNLAATPKTVSVIPGREKPLIRNVTDFDEYRQKEMVAGIPGRFEDFTDDEFADEVIRVLSPEELFYLAREIAAKKEEEKAAREQMWQEEEALRQQGMENHQQRPYYVPS